MFTQLWYLLDESQRGAHNLNASLWCLPLERSKQLFYSLLVIWNPLGFVLRRCCFGYIMAILGSAKVRRRLSCNKWWVRLLLLFWTSRVWMFYRAHVVVLERRCQAEAKEFKCDDSWKIFPGWCSLIPK